MQPRRDIFQRRDGSWAVVFIDDNGLPTIAKLIIVPNFSPVDHFEDAFLKARKTLQDSLVAGDANAFPQFDFRVWRGFAGLARGAQAMSAFDEALRYAMAGVLVFPCRADKKPLTRHGFKDASSDPEVIEAWRRSGRIAISAGRCRRTWSSSTSMKKHGRRGFRTLGAAQGAIRTPS